MSLFVGDSTWESNEYGGSTGVLAWKNFSRSSENSRKGYFLCRCCGFEIVHVSDVSNGTNNLRSKLAMWEKSVTFFPKQDVLIQHFKNANGQEFDVMTSTEANAYRITGEYKGNSLWPGFNWIVLLCPNCNQHIGWQYFKTEKNDDEEKPFFALVVKQLVYENDYLPCKKCGMAIVYTASVMNKLSPLTKSQRTATLAQNSDVMVQLFDNPCGIFSEVVTFRQALAKRTSIATAYYTWWPGFQWSILRCERCSTHLGWEYIPENTTEKPFVGLILHNFLHTDVSVSRTSSFSNSFHYQEKYDSAEHNDYFWCKKCDWKVFHKLKLTREQSGQAMQSKTATVGTMKDVLIQRFKNPHGYEFDVVTVSNASVFRASGESGECTWWSGFNWIILKCPKCMIHIGWEYVPAQKDGTADRPFSGLVFDRLKIGIVPRYKMDRKPRGWCLIINNENFEKPRSGSDKDAERLSEVFGKLQFQICMKKDLDDTDMRSILKYFANMNHSEFDCFVCCVLTHGGPERLSGINGESVTIKDVTANFHASSCKTLVGKPKLFFLQACQGNDEMKGTEIEVDSITTVNRTVKKETEMVPDEADFWLGYATSPGFVSYRNKNTGSYYIQTLCNLLEKHVLNGSDDLETLMTRVNAEVAKVNINGYSKQMPAPVNKLRKKVYFE